jgi:hypothetical protein
MALREGNMHYPFSMKCVGIALLSNRLVACTESNCVKHFLRLALSFQLPAWGCGT